MKEDKRLKRKVRNSYIVSTASVALVLFLLGSVGYLMVTIMQVARSIQESVLVTVELDANIDDSGREYVNSAIASEDLVLNVSYLSKEDKSDDPDFRSMFNNEFDGVLEENPFLDSYELQLSSQGADKISVDAFIERVERLKGVDRVSYPVAVAERLHSTIEKTHIILAIFGSVLFIISLILLNNTIRLAIYSKRYVINTMKMVGATKWFIMGPFIWSSIKQGVLAGIFASLIFVAALYGIKQMIPEVASIADIIQIGIIIASMIGGGVVISLLFTIFSLNKFVNMSSSKIHLY